MTKEKVNLSENLAKLSKIADWFDHQEEVDVEEGLSKVKEASVLIKDSRARLQEIENEFDEVKKEMESSAGDDSDSNEEDVSF